MPPRRRAVLGAAAGAIAGLAGCSRRDRTGADTSGGTAPSSDGTTPTTDGTDPSTGEPTVRPPANGGAVGYTHVRASGNRVLAGRGSVDGDAGDPTVYEVDGRPAWLVGVATGTGSEWVVATGDGRLERFAVADGAVVDGGPAGTLPAGAPPVAVRADGGAALLDRPAETARFSHPVPVGGGGLLFVTGDGALAFRDGDGESRAAVDALTDARLVRVAPGQYALLAGRTGRYDHGALGDAVEADRVVLADVRDGLAVETVLDLSGPVVEGVAPLAADVTGDGTRDLVVTLSDDESGARLAAFDAVGERIATGPGFPTGNRWRHQLCVAPFGPGGERELAAVETPHIGGTARFHRRDGDGFEVVASQSGVSSHALGSRNLDGAVAGDLDGDGSVELLVPTDARDELVALERTDGGVETDWRLTLGGELASNVAGAAGSDGTAVAAAGSDGAVRVWGG